MHERLKILMSAYACEPGKGSEPEVGWQWALQMARWHDVTVLTRANNRAPIEAALANHIGTKPEFLYFDLPKYWLALKKRWRMPRLYYNAWQKAARTVVARALSQHSFDLLHHLTFASYRYDTALWNHGRPMIWGPIGGVETIPLNLLPWRHAGELSHEVIRNIGTHFSLTRLASLRRRAKASTLVLVSTPEMQAALAQYGVATRLLPTIGLDCNSFANQNRRLRSDAPLKLIYVGNLQGLKGIDLAIEAVKLANVGCQFTIIGSGPYQNVLTRLIRRHQLESQVHLVGRRPRNEVLTTLKDFDLSIFPSLHDTGGYAVIEAMANQLPVICLDCGGPAVAVTENCGFKIPVGNKAEIIVGLAKAIRFYHSDRTALLEHGRQARKRVEEFYDWNSKGGLMNEIYLSTVAGSR